MIQLLKRLKPYRGWMFFTVFFVAVQGMADLALPTLMSQIVNKGIMGGDVSYIKTQGFYMLLVGLVSLASSLISAFFSSKVAMSFGRDLRSSVFSKTVKYSLNDFNRFGTASLITRTTNDITQLQMVVIMALRFGIFTPIMSIGGIIMAVSKDAKLTLVLVVIVPILLLTIGLISKRVMPLFRMMQGKLDRLNMVLRENLSGLRVIRAFNKEEYEKNRFQEANADLTNTAIRANKTMALMMPIAMFLMSVAPLAITWFGGIRISEGKMEVGDVMAFIQYSMFILMSFMMIAMIFVMIPRAQVSAERVKAVLELNDENQEKLILAEGTDSQVSLIAQTIQTEAKEPLLEFKHVTFHYEDSEKPVIGDASFTVNPGETTAVIGGTGCGKSTLIQMIPKFYPASQGEILFHGVNINDIPDSALREKIGYVPQKALLFTGTIAENIRYGKDDATIEEIRHASEVAQAYSFIEEMPDKFDSQIAQGGKNLSGGQKQRLAIARALVRKPEIYIFDDSFSALDLKTDAALRDALKNETGDSAVLIVAQRISTIMNADKILVLDEGRIVGMGTHEELLKNCTVYREIALSQLSEEEVGL